MIVIFFSFSIVYLCTCQFKNFRFPFTYPGKQSLSSPQPDQNIQSAKATSHNQQQQQFSPQQNIQQQSPNGSLLTPIRKSRPKIFGTPSPGPAAIYKNNPHQSPQNTMSFAIANSTNNQNSQYQQPQQTNTSPLQASPASESKQQKYFPVNKQMMGCLNKLVEIEELNNTQNINATTNQYVKKCKSLMQGLVKALDSKSLQNMKTQIQSMLEELQLNKKKEQQEQISSNQLQQLTQILNHSLEQATIKHGLLEADEGQYYKQFEEQYNQAVEYVKTEGLKLQSKQVIYDKIRKFNIPKAQWYGYICNQTS